MGVIENEAFAGLGLIYPPPRLLFAGFSDFNCRIVFQRQVPPTLAYSRRLAGKVPQVFWQNIEDAFS